MPSKRKRTTKQAGPPTSGAASSEHAETTSKASLLSLPAEIRLIIYEWVFTAEYAAEIEIDLVLCGPDPVTRSKTHFRISHDDRGSWHWATWKASAASASGGREEPFALMWICQKMRREIMPLVFGRFSIKTSHADALLYFFRDVLPEQRRSIRSICVEYCNDDITVGTHAAGFWVELSQYISECSHLQIISMDLKLDGGNKNIEKSFDPSKKEWTWLSSLWKLNDLDRVSFVVRTWSPTLGEREWDDYISETFSEHPLGMSNYAIDSYPVCLSWIPLREFSDEMEDFVGKEIAKPTWNSRCAVARLKKRRAERRFDLGTEQLRVTADWEDFFVTNDWTRDNVSEGGSWDPDYEE